MHILICLPESSRQPWLELFSSAIPDARIEPRDPDSPPDTQATQADYAVIGWPSASLFVEQRALKAAFVLSAGVGYVLRMPALPPRLPLIRLEDAGMAPQMTRYVLAAAMRFALNLDTYARQQSTRSWQQHQARDTRPLRAGVLGLGVLGTAIARALAAEGFVVHGHALSQKQVEGVQCFCGAATFTSFMRDLDLLVAVLPATQATSGMLNRESLSLMADGAHLINIGRGSLLVEEDLLALLDEGKLSGATLDVFSKEPLPPEHPFWSRPEICVTPHISGLTRPEPSVAQIAAKIARLDAGLSVSGVVDREKNY